MERRRRGGGEEADERIQQAGDPGVIVDVGGRIWMEYPMLPHRPGICCHGLVLPTNSQPLHSRDCYYLCVCVFCVCVLCVVVFCFAIAKYFSYTMVVI